MTSSNLLKHLYRNTFIKYFWKIWTFYNFNVQQDIPFIPKKIQNKKIDWMRFILHHYKFTTNTLYVEQMKQK